ncbi:hypothetical protein C942_01337 [Photobacterium marinum]|uniref:Uncharacterized protein n=1 Tax=Photobacterium marinum TaxID=1056511 RepID=L8JGN5_9GAMM|nr:hypothetical protein C942_01337 [Photobacterium marinum]
MQVDHIRAGEIIGPNPPIAWAKSLGSHITSPVAASAIARENKRNSP